MHPWRKFFLFTGCVILPAIMIGYANYNVFPDSYFLATAMLSATVLIAAIFTWKSRLATARVQQYCILADMLLCTVLCINLGGHWLLAREHSAAKQGLIERHTEEDREGKRRAEEADRQLKLAQAAADLEKSQTAKINAEARRLSRLPVERRQTILIAPQMAPAVPPSVDQPMINEIPKPKGPPRLSPDEVVLKFQPFLTYMAFIDCFAAVLLGALLFAMWEWDRNQNGIPDHLEIAPEPVLLPAPRINREPRPYFSQTQKK